MNIPITISLADEQRAICAAAVRFHRKPRSWRLSEYAMTKATAQIAMDSICLDGTAELFDLLCLSGELARYVRSGNRRAAAVWLHLRDAIDRNPDARRALEQARVYDLAVAKAERLRKRADRLTAAADKLNRAMAIAR